MQKLFFLWKKSLKFCLLDNDIELVNHEERFCYEIRKDCSRWGRKKKICTILTPTTFLSLEFAFCRVQIHCGFRSDCAFQSMKDRHWAEGAFLLNLTHTLSHPHTPSSQLWPKNQNKKEIDQKNVRGRGVAKNKVGVSHEDFEGHHSLPIILCR